MTYVHFFLKDHKWIAVAPLRSGPKSEGAGNGVRRSDLPDWAPWRFDSRKLCKVGVH